jgi:hypothetical protein
MGYSVTISADGSYALCGAPFDDVTNSDTGAVYVFVRNTTTWTQQTILYPSEVEISVRMGNSVAISSDGQYALCGAPSDDIKASNAGAVYVFIRNDTTWIEQTILYPSITTGSPQRDGLFQSLLMDNTLYAGLIKMM